MLTHVDVSSGVYARLALYGADYLMQEKVNDWNAIKEIDEETIRLREEVNLQYQALQQVVRFGDLYGVDVPQTSDER